MNHEDYDKRKEKGSANGFRIALIVLLSVALVVCAIWFATSANRTPAPIPEPLPEDTLDRDVVSPAPDVPALSNSKIGWGVGANKNDKNQPLDAINAQNKYSELGGQFIFPEDDGVMYLTFDLGYENGYTEAILDAMDARGIKGTFFVTMDYVRDAPQIVQRIIDSGHTLANHTTNHPSMPGLSDERVTNELMELHHYVKETFHYEMTLFRYPMGEFSEHSLQYIQNLGYQSIFWSFAYVDWKTDAQPGHAEALQKVTAAMHSGAIYLLHAVSSTNAAIMGDFLDNATAAGYSFGLVDVRLGTVQETPSII